MLYTDTVLNVLCIDDLFVRVVYRAEQFWKCFYILDCAGSAFTFLTVLYICTNSEISYSTATIDLRLPDRKVDELVSVECDQSMNNFVKPMLMPVIAFWHWFRISSF